MKQSFKTGAVLASFFSLFGGGQVPAQRPTLNSNSEIYKNWTLLGESSSHVDVFAQIVNCNGEKQVLFNVFNEGSPNPNVVYTLTVKNTNGEEFSKEITHTIERAKMHIAECGNSEYADLKVVLPEDFDAANVDLSIDFE